MLYLVVAFTGDLMQNLYSSDIRQSLAAMKNGEREAFNEIYHTYRKKVYGFAYRFVRDVTEAGELTQEVFIRIWESRDKIDPEKNFDAYIFSIVRSRFLDALKKKARMTAYLGEQDSEPANDSTDNYINYKESTQILNTAVELLSPQAKSVFLLSRNTGLSHGEIARDLGISKNTVSNHIKKATHIIRSHFRAISPDTILLLIGAVLLSRVP